MAFLGMKLASLPMMKGGLARAAAIHALLRLWLRLWVRLACTVRTRSPPLLGEQVIAQPHHHS